VSAAAGIGRREPRDYAAAMSEPVADRAGRQYWDALWADAAPVEPIDPSDPGFRNHANRQFDAMFRSVFQALPPGAELLEVGCARSRWLPYFALEHGFRVHGLDYSEHGCEIERRALRRAGVPGEVVCADLFEAPSSFRGRFDAVVSFGVLEHFQDTAAAVAALRAYLKPGGILVTVIPNMTGAIGAIERLINPAVYDLHVPLSPKMLVDAHEAAGLAVSDARFFLSTNFGVLNVNGLDATLATRVKAAVCANLSRLSKAVWRLEDRRGPLRATRLLSPYVICVAAEEGCSCDMEARR
jgi:cyclopropane fatty-acyl-phospholipid synthase-like methyltransferase